MGAAGGGRLFGLYCRNLKREDTAMRKYMTGEFLSIGKNQSDILVEDKFVSDRQLRYHAWYGWISTQGH